MNSTRGFGLTVKWRKRLTTSLSVRILDWAGPEGDNDKTRGQGSGSEEEEEEESTKSDSATNSSFIAFLLTCSKLLNGHEREADECEGFAQHFAFVLGCGLHLLPVSLCVCPAHRSNKQTYLPHPESIPLQHCHQCIYRRDRLKKSTVSSDVTLKYNVWHTNDIHKATLPKSMSVKPSAARASPVFLSMFSRQRLASCGSSNNRA